MLLPSWREDHTELEGSSISGVRTFLELLNITRSIQTHSNSRYSIQLRNTNPRKTFSRAQRFVEGLSSSAR